MAQTLYAHPEKFAAIWSARSACSNVVLWFLHRCDLLDEAVAMHWFPHVYRIDVLQRSEQYRDWQRKFRPSETKFIKIIRSPYKRAVSSFHSALRNPKICSAEFEAYLGRSLEESGASFREFLQFLQTVDISKVDTHIREQFNSLESQIEVDSLVNVDKQDLFAALNEFEELIGVARSDFYSGPLGAAISNLREHHTTGRLESDEDYTSVKIRKNGIQGKWPSYASLLNRDARLLIEKIYARDFAAYYRVL